MNRQAICAYLLALLMIIGLAFALGADDPPKKKKKVLAGPKAPGGALKLPAPQSVAYQPRRLISVKADADGDVSWQVITSDGQDLDYTVKDREIIFPPPPAGVTVYLVAAALSGGKVVMARTSITGKPALQEKPDEGDDDEEPPPKKQAKPKRGKVAKAILLVDADAYGPELRALWVSPVIKQGLADRGVKWLKVTNTNPLFKQAGFDKLLTDARGQQVSLPAIVMKDRQGKVIPPGILYPFKNGKKLGVTTQDVLDLVDTVNSGGK